MSGDGGQPGESPLGLPAEPPAPEPHEEPPASTAGRDESWTADHDTTTRDATPALGTRGEPASWRRAVPGAKVALARPGWGDAGWSYLFGRDTSYAEAEPDPDAVAAANERMRSQTPVEPVHGPVIHAAVWTWEVPLYFWFGGMASGASFAALAADIAGDEASARVARKVALATVLPAPALLIADLGRPGRFLNMLRIFKPRSPMNLGAWCLVAFSAAGAGAVGADVLGAGRAGRRLGALQATLGSYLGSYTGVLLATTAVPIWARSRVFLGPIFVATATATGAGATRLTLAALGQAEDHPTHVALARMEAGAILAELALSTINERRLGRAGEALAHGTPARLSRIAKTLVSSGLLLPLIARGRARRPAQNVASLLYLAGGLAFRFAWVEAGKASAHDDDAVALMARGSVTADERLRVGTEQRALSEDRPPLADGGPVKVLRAWSAAVGRASLFAESVLKRVRPRSPA
ncbi:MAG TPA: NrfD/PsrC family molybdoenzyme membrane anchor subunit [Solirubrobacteraceae bacterium]|jgi:formate-dependent nitrite reductase membrane component NrfD|nr:NrfD/PsrC family molybdoenzyme membrane anchor subunit [Solirubrobacteraceae bacterium]